MFTANLARDIPVMVLAWVWGTGKGGHVPSASHFSIDGVRFDLNTRLFLLTCQHVGTKDLNDARVTAQHRKWTNNFEKFSQLKGPKFDFIQK